MVAAELGKILRLLYPCFWHLSDSIWNVRPPFFTCELQNGTLGISESSRDSYVSRDMTDKTLPFMGGQSFVL